MDQVDSVKVDKQLSFLLGLGLTVAFLLPHTSDGLMLLNPLFCILFKCYKQNRRWYKNSVVLVFVLLISLLINLNQEIGQKAFLSFLVIVLYILCFPIVWKVKITNSWLYIIFAYIFISQLVYLLKIPFLVDFYDTYYPIPNYAANDIWYMKDSMTINNVSNYRLGGIYRNPNQCARALTMLLALYTIVNLHELNRGKIVLFKILIIISIILTGSRTGLVVGFLLVAIDIFILNKRSVGWRVSYVILFLGSVVYMWLTSSYRGLEISSGFDDSFNAKVGVFLDYLQNEHSILRLLFGYFDPNKFEKSSSDVLLNMFDADYSYLIFEFGFVGFVGILYYLYTIFKKIDNEGRLLFVVLLWMVTSTIVTSYRAFFIYMLMLSMVYSEHKKIYR